MRGPSPAAGLAELVFVRCRNPFRHGKLFLRVPSATLPPGDDGQYDAFVRGNTIQFRSEANVSEVAAMLKAAALFSCVCLASSAVAAKSPRCASLQKVQEAAGKGTAIAPLTPAQFHFLQGSMSSVRRRRTASRPETGRCS